MNHSVLAFMREQHMTRPGDRVICALSGGKDSMALLHLLLELQEELDISVSAAHFNHQLRGQEAQRDQDFVQRQCEALKVPLFLGGADVGTWAAQRGLGVEDAARTLRYQFFESLAPGARIATAHTAQDNLETMLLRLVRGCGLHGLSGIPPVRGRYIRPLLLTDPAEIARYLSNHAIPHVEDSSNASDTFARNRVRHRVLPPLLAENPELSRSASRLCLLLGQEDRILSQLARQQLSHLEAEGLLSVSGLRSLPEAMALRVTALFLKEVPGLSQTHLEAALRLCESASPSARLSLPGGYVLQRLYDRLALRRDPPLSAPDGEISLDAGQAAAFGPWMVSCQWGTAPEQPVPGTLALKPEGLRLPLTLRSRQPGDQITLPGGTKKLSRLMIDKKIPALWRDTLPAAVQDGQILALLPCWTARSRCSQPGETSLLLSIKEMEETSWNRISTILCSPGSS